MEQAQIQGKRNGCLKAACGGCVLLILAGVMLTVFAWWYLGRWGRGESAWERMPPSVCAAVEIHDMRGMLQHALKDPALVSIIGVFAGYLEAEMPSLADLEYSSSENGRGLVELYREYGFLHTVLAPNVALLALTASDELLIIARLPAYASFYLPEMEPGKIVHWKDDLYLAGVDGWTAISGSEALLAELLDNWDKPTFPLGPRYAASTPYAHIGYKDINQPAVPASRPDAPMMLGNPFANQPVAEPKGRAAKLVIQPRDTDWRIDGAGAWDKTAEELHTFLKEKIARIDIAAYPPLPDADRPIGLAAQTNRENLRHLLEQHQPGRVSQIGPYLEAMRGEVVFETGPPIDEDPYILPAPVITLGIPLRTESAALDIADDLTRRTDGFFAEFADNRLFSQAFSHTVEVKEVPVRSGAGRIVSLPPELANAINPSWLIEANEPPTAWFSTDPTGLERRARLAGALAAMKESSSVPGLVRASLSWNMTDEFRQGIHDLLADRLSMVPDDQFPGKAAVLAAADKANTLFQFYPRGAMLFSIDQSTAFFTAAVPPGTE